MIRLDAMVNIDITDKEKYRQLCMKDNTIPIFSQDWWLDAVAEDKWDVTIVESEGKIVASLPFLVHRRFGFKILTTPALTQSLGPWLKITAEKYSKKLAQEKKLIQQLYNRLPNHAEYNQNWHYKYKNWLPLYWLGYEQTTRYTYRIEDLASLDDVWDGLQENIRREIRKAEKRRIKVRTDLELGDFLNLNKKVFLRQGVQIPYSEFLVRKIHEAASSRNAVKTFIAVDDEGRHHSAVYIVWDENSAYYLLGGGDPDLRNSGATSLCMWEAIKFSSTVTKSFDFEGSMIEPIERFFRGYGAKQTAYSNIKKTNSASMKLLRFIQGLHN